MLKTTWLLCEKRKYFWRKLKILCKIYQRITCLSNWHQKPLNLETRRRSQHAQHTVSRHSSHSSQTVEVKNNKKSSNRGHICLVFVFELDECNTSLHMEFPYSRFAFQENKTRMKIITVHSYSDRQTDGRTVSSFIYWIFWDSSHMKSKCIFLVWEYTV